MSATQQIIDATPAPPVAGDLDRVAFVRWLYAQDAATWTAQAQSVSHNPLALWFSAQGYCLVQVGYSSALLNHGTVDESWVSLGLWGSAFLDACCAAADQAGHNELSRKQVLWAIAEADWALDATTVLNRRDLPAA